MKTGFIYIWLDRKHKRYYIGCHWGSITDGYICSSSWMKQAFRRRPQDFKRRILQRDIQSTQKMFEIEQHWLSFIRSEEFGVRYYNLKRNGHWTSNDDMSNRISNGIRNSVKWKVAYENSRQKRKEARRKNWADNKYRERQIRCMKESVTKERLLTMSANTKKLWENKEWRDNQIEQRRDICKIKLDEMSANTKKLWENKEWRDAQMKWRTDPLLKEKRSQAAKRAWVTKRCHAESHR